MKFLTTRNIIIAVIVLIAIWMLGTYNGLVTAKGGVDGAWAQVQTQYQRRFDVIPNLVAAVKGAANFEQSTFVAVTEARTKWLSAGMDRPQQIAAAQSFDSAMSKLLVTVEAYPQLQATQAFRDFMTQEEGTENRIAVARKDFNDRVQAYNIQIKRFPTNVVAGLLGFSTEAYFQGTTGSENPPPVNF